MFTERGKILFAVSIGENMHMHCSGIAVYNPQSMHVLPNLVDIVFMVVKAVLIKPSFCHRQVCFNELCEGEL